jgi:2,3-bisphosphoglycerate-dependent phosphoglycerate mutase
MQLYLIRHAQSQNNAIWLRGGNEPEERVSDPLITEEGHYQAITTAAYLASEFPDRPDTWHKDRVDSTNRYGFGITHLYCSLMERSVQTACLIGAELGLPVVGIAEFHEAGGIYLKEVVDGKPQIRILHGRGGSYFAEHYPLLQPLEPIPEKGWWRGGREEHHERVPRTHRAIEIIMERHRGSEDRVAVVTHGTFMNYLCRALMGISLDRPEDRRWEQYFWFNNCSITRFGFSDSATELYYHNRCDHLPDDLIT